MEPPIGIRLGKRGLEFPLGQPEKRPHSIVAKAPSPPRPLPARRATARTDPVPPAVAFQPVPVPTCQISNELSKPRPSVGYPLPRRPAASVRNIKPLLPCWNVAAVSRFRRRHLPLLLLPLPGFARRMMHWPMAGPRWPLTPPPFCWAQEPPVSIRVFFPPTSRLSSPPSRRPPPSSPPRKSNPLVPHPRSA